MSANAPTEVSGSLAFRRRVVASRTMIRWGMEGRRLPARLVAIDDRCWFCHAPVRAVAGVLVDPGLTADRTGFVPLADVAGVLMRVVDPAVLARHHIGE